MKPDPSLAGLKRELAQVAHGNRAGYAACFKTGKGEYGEAVPFGNTEGCTECQQLNPRKIDLVGTMARFAERGQETLRRKSPPGPGGPSWELISERTKDSGPVIRTVVSADSSRL